MYDTFAKTYDSFMDNVDYRAWADFICKTLAAHGVRDGLLLDLACGTGTLTELLASAGFDCIGVDGSAEMLQEALSKRDVSGHDILYLEQDMTGFELYGTVRAVVCACDSINYLLNDEDLLQTFRLVNNYLDPGGIFIFDFNTENVYASIGSDTIAETRDDGSFIWENEYDPETGINESVLTLFTPVAPFAQAAPSAPAGGMAGNGLSGERPAGNGLSDGAMAAARLYEKSEEVHIQKAWSLPVIRSLLQEAGLVFECAYDGYTEAPADAASERIVVVARECGKHF